MIVTLKDAYIRTAQGYLSWTPSTTGQLAVLEYRQIAEPGEYEKFTITFNTEDFPPVPGPTPPIPPNPPTGSHQDFFMSCVADYNLPSWPQTPEGRDKAQQVVLNLFNPTTDGRLLAAGWTLTPANASNEKTKVLPPGSVWTRVGFGEGHWVWLPQ